METNKIYLGDAYELIKQIPDKSVDLIVTDPPYEFNGGGTTNPSTDRWYSRQYAHEIKQGGLYRGFDYAILEEFVRVMKKINIYLWCSKAQVIPLIDFFVKGKDCKWEIIVWGKTNPSPFFNGTFLNDKEYCLYFAEKGAKFKATYETSKTVYVTTTNKADKEDFLHPTIKPVSIIENLIKNSTDEGQTVLDPFIGSGTTAVACKHTKRKFIGFELNPKYYQIAIDRIAGWNQKGQMNLLDIETDEN